MNESLVSRLGLAMARPSWTLRFAQGRQNFRSESLDSLADAIDLVSICVRSGLPLVEALEWVQKRLVGPRLTNFSDILRPTETGESLARALLDFEAKQSDSHLREFAMKLALADQLGSPVAAQLNSFASALRANQLIRNKEIATKREQRVTLILVFLVLPITVLFAVYPSLQFLQLQTL